MSMGAWADNSTPYVKKDNIFLKCGEETHRPEIFHLDLSNRTYKSCFLPHDYLKLKENIMEWMCNGNNFEESGNDLKLLIGGPDRYLLWATINREDLTIGFLRDEPDIQCKLIDKSEYYETKDSWKLSVYGYRKNNESRRKF